MKPVLQASSKHMFPLLTWVDPQTTCLQAPSTSIDPSSQVIATHFESTMTNPLSQQLSVEVVIVEVEVLEVEVVLTQAPLIL